MYRKFKHLNIPDSWEQYWSKYPNGYSILEALIDWVGQVDSMTDNVNDWNTYLDGFVATFDTELQNSVEKTLSDWQKSGALNIFINTALQLQTDSIENDVTQLKAQKIDRNGSGQVLYSNLSQEIRLMLTGGSVPVVGADSVLTESITDNAVTPEKTSFITVSPNLFDRENYKVATQFTGSGATMYDFTTTENNAERASNVMAVEPNTTYRASGRTTAGGALAVSFDSAGNYLRGLSGTINADGTFDIVTQATTAYVGFNYSAFEVDEQTFIFARKDIYPSTYIPYGKFLDNELLKDTNERLTAVENNTGINKPTTYPGDEIAVFNKGIAIGDSLTQGTFNTSTGTYEIYPQYSYPAKLQQLTNIEMTNMGDGGITLKRWYERNSGVSWSGHDFAVIAIGVNDAIQGVDILEVQTYLDMIVTKLKNENKGIKIFITTIIPATSYTGAHFDLISSMLRTHVPTITDAYLLDLAEHGLTGDEVAYNNGHLSALGYLRLAQDIKSYISYIIANNKEDFRNVQFIGTELTY